MRINGCIRPLKLMKILKHDLLNKKPNFKTIAQTFASKILSLGKVSDDSGGFSRNSRVPHGKNVYMERIR